MPETYEISTDKSRLNIALIHDYLARQSYWALGRSMAVIEKSIEHSLCFGIYDSHGRQAGFARVVTDYAVFAWLMDVFVLEDHRGQGLAKQLMACISHHPDLQQLSRWGLMTRDAHGLYRQFGFQPLSEPDMMMEKKG